MLDSYDNMQHTIPRTPEALIDPHDPFQNPTENHAYHADYTEIVPQIALPGCRIPLIPSSRETAQIRRYYNRSGIMLLYLMLSSTALYLILQQCFSLLLAHQDKSILGALPENYGLIQSNYFSASSLTGALNLVSFLIANLTTFLLGCKLTHVKIAPMFRTTSFRISSLVRYIGLGFFLQAIAAFLAQYAQVLINGLGYNMVSSGLSTSDPTPLKVAVTLLYGCLVAPITEELVFRGFLLKNLSRVSQRFGIFTTALFFGLMHENITQLLYTIPVGILLGYITTKYNSIVPAILVHAVLNTVSMLLNLVYETNATVGLLVNELFSVAVLLGGGIMLIYTLFVERLPDTTPHQSIRGARIAVTSWSLVLAALCHIFLTILYIVSSPL